jgi:hypothetical protein
MPPTPQPTLIKLDQTQFDQYHLLLTHIGDAIQEFTKDNGKWLSIQNDSILAGFAQVAEAIANAQQQPPPPGPPAKVGSVKFVFPGLKESE